MVFCSIDLPHVSLFRFHSFLKGLLDHFLNHLIQTIPPLTGDGRVIIQRGGRLSEAGTLLVAEFNDGHTGIFQFLLIVLSAVELQIIVKQARLVTSLCQDGTLLICCLLYTSPSPRD